MLSMMESFVSHEEANRILNVLTEYYCPEKVIVFGSFAHGEENPESDLDICVIKDQVPVSPVERRFQVYRLLEDRKIPVDVVVYKPKEFKERFDLGDPFIKTLVNEGKVIYG